MFSLFWAPGLMGAKMLSERGGVEKEFLTA